MAKHETAVFTTEMHAVPFAERKRFAVLAGRQFLHPGTVTVRLKTVLPDIPERVFVDISLIVLAANGRTG